MKIQFYLRFFTQFGQSLFITGNCNQLGNNEPSVALPMQYLTDEFWTATIELDKDFENELQYNYLLKNENGETVPEWDNDRVIEVIKLRVNEVHSLIHGTMQENLKISFTHNLSSRYYCPRQNLPKQNRSNQ